MTTNLQVNDQFPDIALPNHQNELTRLSHFTQPGLLDRHLGFLECYPLILVFFAGSSAHVTSSKCGSWWSFSTNWQLITASWWL